MGESVNTYYSLNGLKLLLIDDDKGLLNSMKYYFEDQDCEVFTSLNGEEGLSLFYEHKPEVVLVDLNMPGVDGHNIVSHLSRNFPDVPIIVVSGTGLIKEAVRSINLGAWDFITKPILNFEELEMSVLKALEKKDLLIENRLYKENLEHLVVERTEELNHKSEKLEKLVEELNIAKEAAEKSDLLKTEFLAQISHEIRTPLTAIMSYIDLIEHDLKGKVDPELAEGFGVIYSSSERIIRTIELILNMSELQLGAYEPLIQYINIESCLEEITTSYKKKLKEKGLSLLINVEKEIPEVKLDKYSFMQVLTNLFDNAYKFTSRGEISIHVNKDGERVKITLIDTGIGITEEYLKKIFEPFTQEEQGYSRKYDGNGLGLSLTKKYCELNNIDMNISSEKEIGTKVILFI
jgi:two-component system, sensor histidine kinase